MTTQKHIPIASTGTKTDNT